MKILSKTKTSVDSAQVDKVISELRGMELKNKDGVSNQSLKDVLLSLLDLIKILLVNIEHSKITIRKLQKLFGFYKEDLPAKEV